MHCTSVSSGPQQRFPLGRSNVLPLPAMLTCTTLDDRATQGAQHNGSLTGSARRRAHAARWQTVPGEVIHCALELLAGVLQVLIELVQACNLLLHDFTALLCCKQHHTTGQICTLSVHHIYIPSLPTSTQSQARQMKGLEHIAGGRSDENSSWKGEATAEGSQGNGAGQVANGLCTLISMGCRECIESRVACKGVLRGACGVQQGCSR